MSYGDPVHGEVHSTDASSGVAIVLYDAGTDRVRTLAADEKLYITSVSATVAATGDTHVFVGADATPGAGETVLRGDLAANGSLTFDPSCAFVGQAGATPFVIAPSGVVDVQIQGFIKRA